MLKNFVRLSFVFLIFFIQKSKAQGCLIPNYDPYNKVFNVPVSRGSTVFYAGNGRNFVLWENVCGPHTYVATTSSPNGTCTVQGISQTGTYYPTVSAPFTRACSVPIDDYVWLGLLLVGGIGYGFARKLNGQV